MAGPAALHQRQGWDDWRLVSWLGAVVGRRRASAAPGDHDSQCLAPWGHTDTAGRMIGERDFTESAIIDLQRDYLRWFDHWLKGVDNGIDKDPLVSLFVMGSNKWLHGQTYPLEITRPQKLYLASN